MEKEKRYTVTIDLYVYAENDEQAIKEAQFYVEHNRLVEDNKASIVSIHETPFGNIGDARNILWGGNWTFEKEKLNKGNRALNLDCMGRF